MRFLIGIDDTDSSRGRCTTHLAFRIVTDLRPAVQVKAYPRLVRLNPNIPFKTRGNAAVSLTLDAADPDLAFDMITAKVEELSDVEGGANSGVVMLEDVAAARSLRSLYLGALSGMLSPHRVRTILRDLHAKTFELGNGMGIVGAASSLGFDGSLDHTFELIAYRREDACGTPRALDSGAVRAMDAATFPHTFNNYDYQKRKVLVAPHGPDPVFLGVRGDSPDSVIRAFSLLKFEESLEGHMVFESNQHTDAHLWGAVHWKAYSSGWLDCKVKDVSVGPGGHAYVSVGEGGRTRLLAAYEPTGDLKRTVVKLAAGDRIRAFGGVRRPSSLHPEVLNLEKIEVVETRSGDLVQGIYVASPRANRHLTKPLIRYGRKGVRASFPARGWLARDFTRPPARARSRRRGLPRLQSPLIP